MCKRVAGVGDGGGQRRSSKWCVQMGDRVARA